MKQFCQECGKQLNQEHKVCIHCGHPVPEAEQVKEVRSPVKKIQKKPMSKQQKLLLTIIGGIIIIIVGFSMWANSYFSADSVKKRFDKAVVSKDVGKISKTLFHSDDTEISESEAESFLALVGLEGTSIVDSLTYIAETGKFLGIYERYQIEAVDQYAAYNNLLEGLSFTFNDEEIEESERDGSFVLYGPFVPGIYDVEAFFENEYGEATVEGSVVLNNYSSNDYEWIDIDIPIDHVVFGIGNFEELDLSKSYFKLADEELSISEHGETEPVGPLLVDGSMEIEVVAGMPWGEVVSEPIKIDDSYMTVYADLITAKDYDATLDVLEQFGEEYVEAMSSQSTKPFKSVTKEAKEILKNFFRSNNEYTGQFDLLEVDKDSMFIDQNDEKTEVKIHAQYTFQEDFHDISDPADLSEGVKTWIVGLVYDESDKEWQISTVIDLFLWDSLEATDERKGSGKLHGPSEEAVASAKDKTFDTKVEQFIMDYTEASIDAINYRDFGLMEKYIDPKGPRFKEADDYIDYLESKEIYEEWYGSEVEKIKELDDDSWEITVVEEFEIIRPDDSEVKKFRTKLIIKLIDDEFLVHELTETKEV